LPLSAAIDFNWTAGGWIHFVVQGHDVIRGPLGVLCYLPLIIPWWLTPKQYRPAYLSISSLLLAFLTLGSGYTLTIGGLTLIGWLMIRYTSSRRWRWLGVSCLTMLYAGFLLWPQPPWFPPVDLPLYFYLHWAGIGYIYLKTLHVLSDSAAGTLSKPSFNDFCAFLLFAPTLRMGPIYRFHDFRTQMYGYLPDRLKIAHALFRFFTAFIRLGAMSWLTTRFPIRETFAHPEQLGSLEFIMAIYAAPISIYLWISGYIDLSIGLGRLMGFKVPENFNYPWTAVNIADFWRRWHITLGAWLRDYIYIPLGGNRRHVFLNYLAAFGFVGVWHGLYPSYICWGLSQGVALGVRRKWSRYWDKQRAQSPPLYRRLAGLRLAGSSFNTALCWLLTFHYQILTIAWFMDEEHTGLRFGRRLLELLAQAFS
jgi:D-alanyl-lipoteichoic acid acyltransferase DltB (MBOAT superfamily)